MLSVQKPSGEQIEVFLSRQAECELSYPLVGITLRPAAHPGFDHDHHRVTLGRGDPVFDAACGALRQWRQFPRPWTDIYPPGAPLEVGVNVAVLTRVLGLWWLNSARIVHLVNERGPIRRFGFAYGTLPGHVERGEEQFTIECDAEGAVWYDIEAYWRPRLWVARLGYHFARRLQRQFIRDSQAAMRAAVQGASE